MFLALYSQVTGIRGLMARSAVDENVTVDGDAWHESDSVPGWQWKGDTSSDEVVGHMFAYPIVYDLIAEGNEEMKEDVEDLVDDIVGELLKEMCAIQVSIVNKFMWVVC